MAKYDVRVRYTFEGTYKVVAEDRDEAERIVTEDCGLVLGGNIHTTRDDDEGDRLEIRQSPRHADPFFQGTGWQRQGQIHVHVFQRQD